MKNPSRIIAAFAEYIPRHLIDTSRPAFSAWIREDRVIISVNPANVRNITALTRDNVKHDISTLLGGVPVRLSNSTGLFFQIGYEQFAAKFRLDPVALDLRDQPTQTAVPLGISESGPLWVSLEEIDSTLIGGTRRMGKTYLIHSWIAALLQGGVTRLYLWDGKGGVEFRQYSGSDRVVLIDDLDAGLAGIRSELEKRRSLFNSAGVRKIEDWNRGMTEKMDAIAVIIDEAAFIPESASGALGELIATGGAFGIYPIIATQRTGVTEVAPIIKTNLSTRIAFPVPSASDSMMILGRAGAEKLPKIKGRFIITFRARLLEIQAFSVDPGKYSVDPDFPVGSDLILFTRAAAETGGRLSIPILTGWGITEWRARRRLDDFQSRGWLTAGPGNTREIDPGILRVISQTLKRPQTTSNG